MEECPSVLGVGPTVDFHHRRIRAAGVVVRRLENPTLQLPAVWRGEVLLLRLRDVPIAQPRVHVRHARFGTVGQHVELAGAARVRGAERDHAGRHVEVIYPAPAAHLFAHVALEVDRVDRRHPGSARHKVDAVALVRPADPRRVSCTHVVDHAVVHGLVEVRSQASRPAA